MRISIPMGMEEPPWRNIAQSQPLNRLFVVQSMKIRQCQLTVPIDILQDSAPPYLFIDFPTDGTVLTTSNTLVRVVWVMR